MEAQSIGKRITDLRADRDIRQGELASAIGIHQSVLNRIEKGRRPVREDELLNIARFFHVTTDYLLDNENPGFVSEHTCTQNEREHLRKYRAIGKENEKHVDALLDSFYNSIVYSEN